MTEVDTIAKRVTDAVYKSMVESLREFADNPRMMDLGGPAALRYVADAFESALRKVNG